MTVDNVGEQKIRKLVEKLGQCQSVKSIRLKNVILSTEPSLSKIEKVHRLPTID